MRECGCTPVMGWTRVSALSTATARTRAGNTTRESREFKVAPFERSAKQAQRTARQTRPLKEKWIWTSQDKGNGERWKDHTERSG